MGMHVHFSLLASYVELYPGELLDWGTYAALLNFRFCASGFVSLDSSSPFWTVLKLAFLLSAFQYFCAMQKNFQRYSFWRTPLAPSQRERVTLFRYVSDLNLSSNCASKGHGCLWSHGSQLLTVYPPKPQFCQPTDDWTLFCQYLAEQ